MSDIQASDRILYLPIVLSVTWPVGLVLSFSNTFGGWLLNPVFIFALWVVSGAGAGIFSIAWLYQRTWLRLSSSLVLLATTLVAGLNLGLVWRTGEEWGAYVDQYVAQGHLW